MADAFKILETELPDYIHHLKNSNSEDKIVHEFTSFIQKVFGIEAKELDFQVSVKSHVFKVSGRMDAVFGDIILEFKKNIENIRSLETAKEELEKYFQSLYEQDAKIKNLGIALDGIRFKVFHPIIKDNKVSGIQIINEINISNCSVEEVFNWFDSYFFSSSKLIPTSEHLKQTFGLNSGTYAVVRQELLDLFEKVKDYNRIKIKFSNWSKFLEIVYGDKPNELNLFIAHTYLSTFAKLLVYLKLTNRNQFRNYDIVPILYGNIFSQLGIRNFVEDDFFTWTMFFTIRKQSSIIFEKILRDLEVYDLEQMNEDVLKELYQEMVRPEVRQQLGEFYTPDWLAEKMVRQVLDDDPQKSVLDPSCGSGTFLFKTILFKIEKLKKSGMNESDILSHILENVIGFDIHPLAAHIAKTNYVLALKGLINSRKGTMTIPVYLSDSIKIPTKKQEITNTRPTFEFNTGISDKKFSFPENFVDNITKMDDVIEKMKIHGHELEEKIGIISQSGYKIDLQEVSNNLKKSFEKSISDIDDHNEKKIIMNNIQTLFELIHNDTDSIWPYVLRNMYKPISIIHKKIDVVLGNPPWLALQFMKNIDYQEFLKLRSKHYGLIDSKKTQNITHLELATLFFCQISDYYLKDKGKIAFVMPRSVLVASQHENFLKFLNPLMELDMIYDLEESKKIKVSPLFRIPSCVLIATKGADTKYPVKSIIFNGKLKIFNSQLDESQKILNEKTSMFEPNIRNTQVSYYYDKFSQGSTIVPGSFWFIRIKSNSILGFNPKSPIVVSEENKNAKAPWNKIKMESNVESDFLFSTIISNDLVPFGHRMKKLIVLPVLVNRNNIEIIKNSSQENISGSDISSYLKIAETYWDENATTKSKKMTIYQRLNYQNGLTAQHPFSKFKVLYVSSATYMTSCVISAEEDNIFNIEGNELRIKGFIADSTTYYFDAESIDEAYYLSCFLNSKFLDDKIKPLQARGSFGGPRHIHKLPLSFGIPKFDYNNLKHKKLTKLGGLCHEKTSALIPTLNMNSIGKIRSIIRTKLSKEYVEIDEIVKILLK